MHSVILIPVPDKTTSILGRAEDFSTFQGHHRTLAGDPRLSRQKELFKTHGILYCTQIFLFLRTAQVKYL
jgi:hypothetical protein